MNRRFASLLTLSAILVSVLCAAFNVQRASAELVTIYIKPDGSVDPPTAPILNVDNYMYTLTADIYDPIVVEKDNIVVDGAGHKVQIQSSFSIGITLQGRTNVAIKNMSVEARVYGIVVSHSSHIVLWRNNISTGSLGIVVEDQAQSDSVIGNNIVGNDTGIGLYSCWGNYLNGNNMTGRNIAGIELSSSSGNNIRENSIANSQYGIILTEHSSNNWIVHNNFMNNTQQFFIVTSSANSWDEGYPSGGNYWSDYNGTDSDHDGIGDTPYVIDADNADHYPFMTEYVIPEFSSILILPLFMMVSLLAVIVFSRKTRAR